MKNFTELLKKMVKIMEVIDVVIPAAGIGKRMKSNIPKQYLLLNGKTVIENTIEKFLALTSIGNIYVVISKTDEYFASLDISSHPKVIAVDGGAERCDSVINGLKSAKTKYVLVHDAARPCVKVEDISKLISCACDRNGGLLVSRVCDTMKRSDANECVCETVSRVNLYHALTPQLFERELLLDAYLKASEKGYALTDESSAMEFLGFKPKIVIGSSTNLKITESSDLRLAELYLNNNIQ